MKTSRERECVRESLSDWKRLFCREVRASLGYMVGSRPTSATVCRAPSQNQGKNKREGGGASLQSGYPARPRPQVGPAHALGGLRAWPAPCPQVPATPGAGGRAQFMER